jgi:hypothetical protein
MLLNVSGLDSTIYFSVEHRLSLEGDAAKTDFSAIHQNIGIKIEKDSSPHRETMNDSKDHPHFSGDNDRPSSIVSR